MVQNRYSTQHYIATDVTYQGKCCNLNKLQAWSKFQKSSILTKFSKIFNSYEKSFKITLFCNVSICTTFNIIICFYWLKSAPWWIELTQKLKKNQSFASKDKIKISIDISGMNKTSHGWGSIIIKAIPERKSTI